MWDSFDFFEGRLEVEGEDGEDLGVDESGTEHFVECLLQFRMISLKR